MKSSQNYCNVSIPLSTPPKLSKLKVSEEKSTLPNSPSYSSNGKETEFFVNYWNNLPDSTKNETIQVSKEEIASILNTTNKKHKTEICKNWEIKGACKFGDKVHSIIIQCSFAHGHEELREKCILNENFKSKPCRSYFLDSYCNYGTRCQYLHSDLIYEKQHKAFLLKSFKDKGFNKDKLKNIESFKSYGETLNSWLNNMASRYPLFNSKLGNRTDSN